MAELDDRLIEQSGSKPRDWDASEEAKKRAAEEVLEIEPSEE